MEVYEQKSYIAPMKYVQFISEAKEPDKTVLLPSISINQEQWKKNNKSEKKLIINGAFAIQNQSLKGWFNQTLPPFLEKHTAPVSFLHVDCDLYSSTKVCLEHLYPKVVDGGFVIIDDYALNGCKKAVHEYLNLHGLAPQIKLIPGGNPDSDENGPAYWRVVK